MEAVGRKFFSTQNIEPLLNAIVDHIRKTNSLDIDKKNKQFLSECHHICTETFKNSTEFLRSIPKSQQLKALNQLVFNHIIRHIQNRINSSSVQSEEQVIGGSTPLEDNEESDMNTMSIQEQEEQEEDLQEVNSEKEEENNLKPEINIIEETCELIIDSFEKEKEEENEITLKYAVNLNNVSEVNLKSADLEKSDYNIHENNCEFHWKHSESEVVKLEIGHYSSIRDLLQELNRLLNNHKIELVYNTRTGKVTISSAEVCDLEFNEDKSIGFLLGFDRKMYTSSNTYTAESKPRLNDNNRYVILEIPEINIKTKLNLKKNGYPNVIRTFHHPIDIEFLSISFKRPDGTLYNFRGRPWCLSLNIKTKKINAVE